MRLPSTKLSRLFLEAANRTRLGGFRVTLRGRGTNRLLGIGVKLILVNAKAPRGQRPTFCDSKADAAVNKVFQVDGPLLERWTHILARLLK